MSNHDVQPSGSQAVANAAFLAELQEAANRGDTNLCQYWAKLINANTGNKLYKNS